MSDTAGDRSDPASGTSSLSVAPLDDDGRPHAYCVTMSGALDLDAAPGLDRRLDGLIASGARFVVLNLADVSFLDSSGIRSIARAARALGDVGGRLTCRGLSGAAQRVLEISGLLEHLRDPEPEA